MDPMTIAALAQAAASVMGATKKQQQPGAGMPGKPFQMENTTQGAMQLQQANAMQPPQPAAPAAMPDTPLKDFFGQGGGTPMPTNTLEKLPGGQLPGVNPLPGGNQFSPVPGWTPPQSVMPQESAAPPQGMTSPLDQVSSTFKADPTTSDMLGNAQAAASVGMGLNDLFNPPPPRPGGMPGRPFDMPNTTLGLKQLLMGYQRR
jgi:hypothetical protein